MAFYNTKREAAEAMIKDGFSAIPQDLITMNDEWYEVWECHALNSEYDEEYDEEWEKYSGDGTYDGMPMWGTLWFVSDCMYDGFYRSFINKNREAVIDLGFTIIECEQEGFMCLGIDGAGYDFYETHWMPLYDLFGFKWHKEEAE